jgi:sulfotransferase family protein
MHVPMLGRENYGRRGSSGWRRFGTALGRWLLSLDGKALCREARRRTGLEDFGDPSLGPGLSILLKSLEEEAELHVLGRFLMRVHLRDLLETRLRLRQAWRGKGEALAAVRIERPVFIVGMPRSGSTFLHELLAEDPANRVPRVWEVMFPVAAGDGGQRDRGRRIRKAGACLWWFRRLAPEADFVYPMRALTPHECVAIHSYTFLSEEFISTCRIPSYEAFLHSADLTPAYAWQKRFLQHLEPGAAGKRWVLKSPDHVYGLKELFTIFPDAAIIQTHRNPLEVLRSSTHLTQVLHGLYARAGDRAETRAREARVLAEGTERFIQFRDLHPELADRFIDVKYSELVADPVASVSRIYRQLGIALSAVAAERMQQLALGRSRYRGRRAAAEPIDARGEAPVEARRFERYCSRFDIPFRIPGLR